MKKNTLFIAVLSLICAFVLMPESIFASVADTDYGQKEIAEEAIKIKGYIWKTLLPICGTIAVISSIIFAWSSQSAKPLFFLGGLGFAAVILPKFIDGIFGSLGMLIP